MVLKETSTSSTSNQIANVAKTHAPAVGQETNSLQLKAAVEKFQTGQAVDQEGESLQIKAWIEKFRTGKIAADYVRKGSLEFVRVSESGKQEVVPLEKGEKQWAIAKLSDGTIVTTDVPNLALVPIAKVPKQKEKHKKEKQEKKTRANQHGRRRVRCIKLICIYNTSGCTHIDIHYIYFYIYIYIYICISRLKLVHLPYPAGSGSVHCELSSASDTRCSLRMTETPPEFPWLPGS